MAEPSIKGSLDITGVGKLAEHIPDDAWTRMVGTACDTIEQVLKPITETTSGLGRLIRGRFDRYEQIQQVLTSMALQDVADKIDRQRPLESPHLKDRRSAKPEVVLAALDVVSMQFDETLRDLWTNLIAHEILGSDVHPELVNVLKHLSPVDARVLATLATAKADEPRPIRFSPGGYHAGNVPRDLEAMNEDTLEFSLKHLESLGLIVPYRSPGLGDMLNRIAEDLLVIAGKASRDARKLPSEWAPHVDRKLPVVLRYALKQQPSRMGILLLSAVSSTENRPEETGSEDMHESASAG